MNEGAPSTALVLVADDEEDIVELVAMVLEEDGYEVVTANDGEQALRSALSRPPDLCLLDVMMPKLDGCEVTRQLRAHDETRDIPIILLSARTQRDSVERGREAGADEYVTKPFVNDDLQRSVRSLLASSRPAPGDAAEAEVVAMPGLPPAPEPSAAVSRTRVLVAAQDVNVVKLIVYRLELGGYQAAAAYDAEQAAKLASEHSPAICVLDPGMPALDEHLVVRIESRFSVQELYQQVEERLRSADGQRRTA